MPQPSVRPFAGHAGESGELAMVGRWVRATSSVCPVHLFWFFHSNKNCNCNCNRDHAQKLYSASVCQSTLHGLFHFISHSPVLDVICISISHVRKLLSFLPTIRMEHGLLTTEDRKEKCYSPPPLLYSQVSFFPPVEEMKLDKKETNMSRRN